MFRGLDKLLHQNIVNNNGDNHNSDEDKAQKLRQIVVLFLFFAHMTAPILSVGGRMERREPLHPAICSRK